jgi:glucose/arabinose dehydrogenase
MIKHTRPTTMVTRALLAPVLVVSSLVAALLPALPAQAVTSIAKINFQPAAFTTPAGYTADTGLPYTAARGFGWIDQSDSNPLDMTVNTRSGNSIPPAYARVSDMMMQPKGAASGRWEYAIANGTYNVTLTVGDARMSSGTNYCCIDGTMRLSVEGVEVVKDFVATPAAPLQTTSANIAVADGKLTVDAVGGINTKFDHIEITTATGPAQGAGPLITGVTPAAGTTGVALNTAVSLAVSAPVDLSTVTAANVKVTSTSGQVAGNYNADAAGGTVSFTPGANLAVSTVYTVTVTSGLKGSDGQSFAPFTSTFTTGTAPPPLASTAFSKLMSVTVPKPNVVLIGPDGKLYVGCAGGQIYRFARAADGSLSSPEIISPFGNRVINGLAFDPINPTKLWVVSGYAGYTDAPPMSGHLSTLIVQSGQPLSADTASATDVIVGFPRSMHDHMTNGIAFGPDGKLYIAQGANTSYGGAPDPYWGARGEAPLTASILVADVDNTSVFPSGTHLDVNTDPVGFTEATGSDAPAAYNPKAASAPVKVYAYGTRNPYTLMWDSNGTLYAPVNESAAGGVTPAGPGNVPVSVSNIQAYTDYFTRVQAGKYYGHPNATQGYYALNGGNPTSAGDPYEVTEYPVGTKPDANWQAPDFAMGVHRSPDGAAEYTNASAFSGALKGKILVSEYSDGDDIVAFTLDANGKPVSEASLPDADNPGQALIFNNPLGLAVDATSGVVYVAEHLDETSAATGQVTVIVPSTGGGTVNNGVHVNFQPSSVTAPAGYAADTGAPFNGQIGWQDLSGNPIDMTANTRVAHAAASPDVRYDTDLLMQAPSGSGNTTPGQWATTLPNGAYDVTVAVGDPLATNSVDEIVAQPGTANAVTVIDQFAPTTASPWSTVTKRVTVSSGLLVLSPTGGTNTKIDFVDAVPATADTLAPSVTLSVAGTLTSGTTYSGPVTVSASSVDNVGVTSTTYVLDGGAATTYTAPVVVSAAGSHTITVTAKDAAGNPGVASKTFTVAAATPPTGGLHVDFGAQTTVPFTGYTLDYGAAFTAASGSGWEDQTTGAPVSAIGNGRERGSSLSPDKRYDTLVQMQETAASTTGTHTAVRWEHAIANGTYTVTVAVGDATATNSVDTITAEPGTVNSTVIISNFQATSTTLFQTMTKTVTVSDGFLTLSAVGGTNSKIDFVDALPVTTSDTTKPTASIALAGSFDGTDYTGAVTATVTSADEAGGSGLASTTYVLDTAAAKAYTGTVTVSAVGDHTLTVTATDVAGNATTVSKAFTIVAPPPDTTKPTGSIALAGSFDGTDYTGAVTATVTAADEAGGSGLAPTTYVLDGAGSATYTAPIVVSAPGDHTLVVTITDNATNFITVEKDWTSVAAPVDTTPPTVSLDLSGTTGGPGYLGDVTVTATVADAGGSGLASTTYVLDGAAAKPYTAAVVVSAAGDHSMTVTAKDGAGNTTSATKTWSSALVDTVKPTVSLALAGALYSGTTYGGNVTVTATASDNTGGSGLATTTYVLDTAASATYLAPVVVTTVGSHTLTVTATDNQGNSATATKTWTQQTPDVTKPTASVALGGTLGTGGVYTGSVTATATSADETGGSGLKTTTYSLDGGAVTPYTVPVVVTAVGSHTLTVTVTDNAGNVGTASSAWNQATSGGTAKLVVTSPDDTVLANPSTPRLVFSAVRSLGATPARAFTFTNNGTGSLTISNLAIGGTNASSWKLNTGQATSIVIAAGGTAQVSVLFTPTDPTGCASTALPYAIGDVDRNATLTFTTNDSTQPNGSALLSGVNSCYVGGNNEPVLDQLLPELGYTDNVDTPGGDRRYIGPARYQPGTDEIQSPYFNAANSALPVSVIPITHYGSANTVPYQATGWYAAGSAMTQPLSTCSSACKTLWQFPADTISGGVTTYNQNQKLLPGVTGVTTFTPTGTFGLFSGDFTDTNFSDDSLNVGHTTANVDLPVPHYTHGMRVYPAYGAGHVVIPNTYIVGIDLSRVPAYKNNDFQDIVLLVRNVTPALAQGPLPGAATTDNLAAGGTVSSTCAVTGFDGVLANTTNNACNAGNIVFNNGGLTLTSTAGQLANLNQQNALYKTFDATHNQFTVTARVVGPLTQIATDFQQVGVFFGPDTKNFVKAEVDSEGSTQHLTMFYSEKGVTSTVATVALPAVTTASTVDLIITGNDNVPDPLPYGDTYGVHNFPLDQLTVSYSINGAAPVKVGTAKAPADVTGWFNRQSKAGILVSNSGTATPIAATFTKFAITAP